MWLYKNGVSGNEAFLLGQSRNIRVFPKVDHSANIARIVLVDHKVFVKLYWTYGKYLAKFYLNINNPLPVLPGNEHNLCHENIDLDLVNTYLFYQVCKLYNIVSFRDQSANVRSHYTLASDISA